MPVFVNIVLSLEVHYEINFKQDLKIGLKHYIVLELMKHLMFIKYVRKKHLIF